MRMRSLVAQNAELAPPFKLITFWQHYRLMMMMARNTTTRKDVQRARHTVR